MFDTGVRTALTALSPGGQRARLTIFIFHRVLRQRDELQPDYPTAEEFEQRVLWLRNWFNVLPLEEAVDRLESGSLPARAAAITFDDGYADNLEVASPILRRHQLPATLFVATGFLDGGRMFNDSVIEAVRAAPTGTLDLESLGLGRHELHDPASRRDAIDALLGRVKYAEPVRREALVCAVLERVGRPLPSDLMLTRSALTSSRGSLMSIGCHTVNHPILTRLAPEAARREIEASRNELADILGDAITLFAYPNGRPQRDYGAEHVRMVRELGFKAAVSTARGAAHRGDDLYQLPRFTPWDRSMPHFALRTIQTLGGRRHAVA